MEKKDWAYFKVKLPDRQEMFCTALARKGGACDSYGVGIDFGGWTAHFQIITALKRKGVLVEEKKGLKLVVGEPVPVAEPKLGKPYMKVRKQLLHLFDGDKVSTQNAQIYLDPRGDSEFLILLPPIMKGVVSRGKVPEGDGDLFAATGASLVEVVADAENMSIEYVASIEGEVEEVILVSYATPTAGPKDSMYSYSQTGLTMRYDRLLRLGDKLYYHNKVGRLDLYCHLSRKESVVIPYTPERLAALEALRSRLEDAGAELRKIITGDDFVSMIDQHGGRLLLMDK